MGVKKAIQLAKIVIRSRWVILCASFLMMASSGGTYIFGLYSPTIKSALNYDQKTLDKLGFFKDLGANVGILAGLVSKIAPPWALLAIGSTMNLAGYVMVWRCVTGSAPTPRVWQMYLYITMGANSQTFTNTASVVTCVNNFPGSRGVVLGTLKGFAGLSGAILTLIYHAFYGDHSASLILLIGWLPCVVCVSLMGILRQGEVTPEGNELNRFYAFLIIIVSHAAVLTAVITLENRLPLPAIFARLMAITAVLSLLVPLGVVVKSELEKLKLQDWKIPDPADNVEMEAVEGDHHPNAPDPPETQRPQVEEGSIADIENGGESEHASAGVPAACEERQAETPDNDPTPESGNMFSELPKRGEHFTCLQALRTLDLWLILVGTACGMGAALTAVDNMGQIGTALGFSRVDMTTLVSLISIWDSLGRVTSGYLSDFLLKKCSIPRPAVLCVVLVFSCVGHILIALAVPRCLYVASVLLGFCFGAQMTATSAILSELFGLRDFSTILNVVSSVIPLGIYVFSVRVAGSLYDREARKQYANHSMGFEKAMELAPEPTPHHHNLVCKGPACFRLTFIIMALVSLVGVMVLGVLSIRTKKFYSRDLDASYRQQAMEAQEQQENSRP